MSNLRSFSEYVLLELVNILYELRDTLVSCNHGSIYIMAVVCDDVITVENVFSTPDMFKHLNTYKSLVSIISAILS